MSEAARLSLVERDPKQDLSLPGWIYRDPEFFGVEMERVIRPAWQIVCHESEIAEPGEWRSLDYLGESVIVIRGTDGEIRAFANVCRHRGSRLVDGEQGCARRLTCPYHGWTYAADGRLIGVPHKEDYRGLEPRHWGLLPVELDRWHGFLFVRLEGGGPGVAEMMAPYEAEIAPHRLDEVRALGRITLRPRQVNWKNVADNYSDGLHIPVAHPGLTRLFGGDYRIEAGDHVDRMSGDLVERPSANLSERAYQKLLPQDAGRSWLYFKLWPNLAFDLYPDQIDFMHFVPVGPTETLIREISYALPDQRREMKAARYLNWRINRRVNLEDTALIARVQRGMESRLYVPGPLGESEVCLRSFAAKLRRLIPEARLDRPPAPGWSARSA
ncbi:aromatic ring-hydroxylating oxygenase subunit alpha [Sphingosinicella terrae]|uniref:aromatic ring-hydroxylating oxygenase subunit alpha n=1 Tax=Sphingosinicella terrae TaxID=2172047 RepID=UPI000E0DF055|nr:aromatic ring-hydroxylating dioxygenase subunit alpha [Sphingosinicella terrae]